MYPDDERAEELKEKLKEFYGTAITSGMPMAIIDFAKVENMTDEVCAWIIKNCLL